MEEEQETNEKTDTLKSKSKSDNSSLIDNLKYRFSPDQKKERNTKKK